MSARDTAPLLPCPFCGGTAQIIEVEEPSNRGGYVVQCDKCEASTRVWFPIKDDVKNILTDAWNKRAQIEAARDPGPPFDPSNHHNALACPYCNPDKLSLAAQSPKDSQQAIFDHQRAAAGYEPSNRGGYVVQCDKCEASTRVWFPIKDDVKNILTDAWNKRAQGEAARDPGPPQPLKSDDRAELLRSLRWIQDFSMAHHAGEPVGVHLHRLVVDIPDYLGYVIGILEKEPADSVGDPGLRVALAQARLKLHRYTITSEGASPGYFRLVEDPEGVWLTWAEVDALLARVTPHTSPWQPIETVPRDGRNVLVARGDYINRAFWADDRLMMIGGHWAPTHWMPLPDPPRVSTPPEE